MSGLLLIDCPTMRDIRQHSLNWRIDAERPSVEIISTMEQQDEQAGPPLKWHVMIFFAAVPLLAATLLLQLLGSPSRPLSDAELDLLHISASGESFLPGAITYAILVTIHVFVCLAAIVFARLVLRSVPGGVKLELAGFALAAGIAGLILALAALNDSALLAYRLTYLNFEELFRGTGAGGWLLDAPAGMTTLGLAGYLPTVLGTFAVALTTSAAVGQLSLLDTPAGRTDEEEENLLCLAAARIKRLAYALSLVLVTSTVAASLYFQLPAKLIVQPEGRAAIARIEAYGAELTLFWGGVYTLTLIAAIGVPLLLVQKQVRDFLERLHPPERAEPFRERMARAGALTGGGEQMKVLIAFVAPLVSAPVTSFLQAAAG